MGVRWRSSYDHDDPDGNVQGADKVRAQLTRLLSFLISSLRPPARRSLKTVSTHDSEDSLSPFTNSHYSVLHPTLHDTRDQAASRPRTSGNISQEDHSHCIVYRPCFKSSHEEALGEDRKRDYRYIHDLTRVRFAVPSNSS